MPLSLEGIVQTSKKVLYSTVPVLPEIQMMKDPDDISDDIASAMGMISAFAKVAGVYAVAIGSILGAGPVDMAAVIAGATAYASGTAATSAYHLLR